jgi:hypothetical protein
VWRCDPPLVTEKVYALAAAEGVALRLAVHLLVELPNAHVPASVGGLSRCYKTLVGKVADGDEEALINLDDVKTGQTDLLTYVAAAVPGRGVRSIELLLDGKALLGTTGGVAQLAFEAWLGPGLEAGAHTRLCLPLSAVNHTRQAYCLPVPAFDDNRAPYMSGDLDLGAPAVAGGTLQLRLRLDPGCSRGDGVVHVLASFLS